jgi:hypothetical protein
MTLNDYQKTFLNAVIDQTTPDWHIQNKGKASLEQRLGVYRDSMMGNHLKVLRKLFPLCERLVGEAFFLQLCEQYLESASFNMEHLDDIAQGFSTFLETHSSHEQVPYLMDMARLEWAWHEVLRDETQERLITSEYPLFDIWKCCQPDYQGDFTLPEPSSPEKLMLFQKDQAVHLRQILHS